MKGEDEGCYFVIHKRGFHIKKLIYAISIGIPQEARGIRQQSRLFMGKSISETEIVSSWVCLPHEVSRIFMFVISILTDSLW